MSANKRLFIRGILPPLAGVVVTAMVLGLLNAQWITAQIQYHLQKPAIVVTQPIDGLTIDTSATPEIIIPKTNAKAPIVFDEPSHDETKIQQALKKGVLHYGNTAEPGQNGTVVLFGHSSGQIWAPGNYKFVFTLLSKLQNDDKIIIDYKGTRYIYKVKNTKIVQPNDFTILNQTDTPTLNLVTCTPAGTSKYRLVVQAEQISPKPETATKANTTQASSATTTKYLPKSASRPVWQTLNPFKN